MTSPTSQHPRLSTIPPATRRRSSRPGWRWTPLLVALLAAAAVAAAVAGGVSYVVTAGRGQELADTATQACNGGDVAPSPDGLALCDQAAQVQAMPITVEGLDGRGIFGTSVVDGRLVVRYSDGTSEDVGQVVGAEGEPGAAGRGITDSDVVEGRLMISYNDGAVEDLGVVIGQDGRGIASTAAVDGRLLVTYTDGDVEDAGPLPAGPEGPQGGRGDDGEDASPLEQQTFTLPDGSTRVCDRVGGPDSAPEFRCGEATPAPVAPDDTNGGG